MKHKTIDLAYFSGYIDGDGCFYIGHVTPRGATKSKKVVSIVVSSLNKHTLDRFKNIFGGSVCIAMKENNNSKTLYNYTIRRRNLTRFIDLLHPYLVEKRDQAILLIDFCGSRSYEEQSVMINTMKIIKDSYHLVSKYHKKEFEKLRSTVIPTEEDYAYLAGFVDAECSLGISKYKPNDKPNYTYKVLLQCNNTKYPVFKWLLERFGGTIHFVNRLKSLKSRKNQLTWRLSALSLYEILPKIQPFLFHKQPVCDQLILFYKTTLKNGGARHTDVFRSSYQETMKKRESIVFKVHELNAKGIKKYASG